MKEEQPTNTDVPRVPSINCPSYNQKDILIIFAIATQHAHTLKIASSQQPGSLTPNPDSREQVSSQAADLPTE